MITAENLPLTGDIKVVASLPPGYNYSIKRKNEELKDCIELKGHNSLDFTFRQAEVLIDSENGNIMRDFAYGKGVYVGVGFSGQMLASTNNIEWTQVYGDFGDTTINAIAFGKDVFVAGGNNGKLAMSINGYDWMQMPSYITSDYNIIDIKYINDMFVMVAIGNVVGIYAPSKVLTSIDGITWNSVYGDFSSDFELEGIAYGNGIWVLSSHDYVYTSPDMNNWTQRRFFYFSESNGITFGNGIFIIGNHNGQVVTSTDGINWKVAFDFTPGNPFSLEINRVDYGNGIFLLGLRSKIFYSTNGDEWTEILNIADMGVSGYITSYAIKYENGVWIICTTGSIILSAPSLHFELQDIYIQNNTTYTYSVETITDNESTIFEETTITSQFCDTFICDAYNSYKITNELQYNNLQRVQKGGVFEPFSKYPTVINNGITSYESGIFSFAINSSGTGKINRIEEISLRKKLAEFLSNKKAKIIKDINGNIWIAVTPAVISQSFIKELGNGVADFSFTWIEIGDAKSLEDLERLGMLDVFKFTK